MPGRNGCVSSKFVGDRVLREKRLVGAAAVALETCGLRAKGLGALVANKPMHYRGCVSTAKSGMVRAEDSGRLDVQ